MPKLSCRSQLQLRDRSWPAITNKTLYNDHILLYLCCPLQQPPAKSAEHLKNKASVRLYLLALFNFNISSHMWLGVTILDSAGLQFRVGRKQVYKGIAGKQENHLCVLPHSLGINKLATANPYSPVLLTHAWQQRNCGGLQVFHLLLWFNHHLPRSKYFPNVISFFCARS